jgi:hypothetical protein
MLYSDHILPLNKALEMEVNGDIQIYHSGRVSSFLTELPRFNIWNNNWENLILKNKRKRLNKIILDNFDYMIEYKFKDINELSTDVWVYMYAKCVVGGC